MPYRLPTTLELSAEERGELASWARRRETAQGLALRARIVLLAADGLSNTAIAAELATGRRSGAPTTMPGMAPPACLRHST